MKNILVVEDEKNIQDILAYNLEKEGFKLFTADNGVDALSLIEDGEDIDLILMDVMMPKMDGYTCLQKLREISNIPIIMLTALESEDDTVKGLDLGANDYVTKPFHMREVIARIKANLKSESAGTLTKKFEVIKMKGSTYNPATLEFNKGENTIALSDTESKIFMFLFNNKNVVFSREEILNNIWGSTKYDYRTVDVNIRRMREKIEEIDTNPQIIKTVRGRGYYFNSEVLLV